MTYDKSYAAKDDKDRPLDVNAWFIFTGDFPQMLESVGKLYESQRKYRNLEESQGKSTVSKKVPGEK